MWKTHLSSQAWAELAEVLKAKLAANRQQMKVVNSTFDGMIKTNSIAASTQELEQLLQLPQLMMQDCEEMLEQVMESLLESEND